jgi:rhodanese-related sulfurtransferase
MVLQPVAARRLLFLAVGAIALQRHIGDRAATLRSIHNRRINAALGPAEARENIRTIYDAVIDVRMSAEHRLEGRIVDSHCIPAQLWEHGMYLPRDVAARVEITRPTPSTRHLNTYTQAFVPDVLEQFETDCRLLCVCGDGRRSELAAQQLEQEGFSVDYIDGGLDAWAEQSLELEVEDDGGLVGSYV